MWKAIKEFFGIYSNEVKYEPVKAPEPTKCSCGRSPTGLCMGLHNLTGEQWAVDNRNPNAQAAQSAKKPAKVASTSKEVKKSVVKTSAPVSKTPSKKKNGK
jgi:hypothetical protein